MSLSRISPLRILPRLAHSRPLHSVANPTYAHSHLDLYGRYRRPGGLTESHGPFETVSTVPAGTSFQMIPSSASLLQTPIPAMKGASANPDLPTTKEITVEGVIVPPKPKKPGEEECCMSGCAFCVYDIYADELETYTGAVQEARTKLEAKGTPTSQWPEEIRPKDTAAGEVAEEALDPSMAAFLALEKKIKKKQAPQSSGATP